METLDTRIHDNYLCRPFSADLEENPPDERHAGIIEGPGAFVLVCNATKEY